MNKPTPPKQAHYPVSQAVLNLLAIHGYEIAPEHRSEDGKAYWVVYRISDHKFVESWNFDSDSMDYVKEISDMIKEFEWRVRP